MPLVEVMLFNYFLMKMVNAEAALMLTHAELLSFQQNWISHSGPEYSRDDAVVQKVQDVFSHICQINFVIKLKTTLEKELFSLQSTRVNLFLLRFSS